MSRLKVVNKKVIAEALQKGGAIRYIDLSAKAYLEDANGNTLGAIRFDTFLHWPRAMCARDAGKPYAIRPVKSHRHYTSKYQLPEFAEKKG